MKRFLPFILGLTSLALHAQKNTQLSYEEHLNYSLGAYLNTPLSNIRVAGAKWLSGDTTAAIQYVQAAVRVGMYDSFMVKSSPYLNGFTALKEWNTIRLSIDKNIETVSHPSQLKIYTDDVKRFFRLLPKMTGKQGESVFWKEYIAAGTTGLKTFYNVRMSSRPDVTTHTIRKYQSFYKGLEPLVAQLPSFEKRILAAAYKLEAIYPEAFYPPVYFLVGNMNAAGTPDGGAGQLVGIEFFSNYPGRDTAGLSKWFRSVISDTSRVVGLTVHEMIHIQQKNLQSQTVLAKVLTEGACDFITYLLLNEIILPRQHAYGNAHKKEIYDRLIKEKATTDLSYWMYNSEIEEKGIPSDLGYYIGFKICEAYYNKQTDKKQAVKDILEIRNYEQFLKESGYGDQFQ